MIPAPTSRKLVLTALTALTIIGLGRELNAQFLYTLEETGRVHVNGTLLDKLPGNFDPGDLENSNASQVWWDMVVSGADRWALRVDGLVQKNGVKIEQLSQAAGTAWIALVIDGTGAWWALRTDGLLNKEGANIVNHEEEGDFVIGGESQDDAFPFDFTDLIAGAGSVWPLREDGCIFRDSTPAPFAKLDAGEGLEGNGEGTTEHTRWREFGFNAADGMLLAIRRDGHVLSLDPAADGTPSGTLVAELPFVNANNDEMYRGITFDDGGAFHAITGDGRVFASDSLVDPKIDLPGQPSSGVGQNYMDIVWSSEGLFMLRFDGHIYQGTDEVDEVLDVTKDRHRRLAIGDTVPDLTNVKNKKPCVVGYKVTLGPGQALTLPVIVSDADLPSADLVITHDASTVPPGAVWDAEARELTWAAPGPAGKYKFKLTVDDGSGAKPKKVNFPIKVLGPDKNVLKNKPAKPSKIKNAKAFVGVAFVLPILAWDADGDAIAVTLDPSQTLPVGVTFDEEADELTWTPELSQLGKKKIRFLLDDGTKVKKAGVSIKVETSLLGF